MIRSFYYGIPIFGLIVLGLNLYQWPQDAWFRLSILVPFFVVSYVRPTWALLAVCASAAWWEIPTLRLEIPNQFAIESGILGFISGNMLRFSLRDKDGKQVLNKAITNPFVLPMLFASVLCAVSFAVLIGPMAADLPTQFAPRYVFLQFTREAFRWDVKSYVHGPSIAFGMMIQIGAVIHMIALLNRMSQTESLRFTAKIVDAIIFGSIAVFAYAFAQFFEIPGFPVVFSVDIGGTFQNGNHLSFFSGFIALLTIWRLNDKTSLRPTRSSIFILILLVSIAFMFVGRGRAAILAIVLPLTVFAIYLYINRKDYFRNLSKELRPTLAITGAVVLVLGFVGGFRQIIEFLSQDQVSHLYSEVPAILMSSEPWRLLLMSGRDVILSAGIEMFREHWLTGIGLGNFFLNANLNIALHNAYLEWVLESGVFAGFALVVGLGYFLCSLINYSRVNFFGALALLATAIYVGLIGLADTILTYRSIFTIVSMCFTALLYRIDPATDHKLLQPRSVIWTVILIAIAIGLVTILEPQYRNLN